MAVVLRLKETGEGIAVVSLKNPSLSFMFVNGSCEVDEEVAERVLAHPIYAESIERVAEKPKKVDVVKETLDEVES